MAAGAFQQVKVAGEEYRGSPRLVLLTSPLCCGVVLQKSLSLPSTKVCDSEDVKLTVCGRVHAMTG